MAALNVTQTGMTAGAQRFLSVVEIPAELEKISCWFGGCSQANPFDFFGKRIRVGEQVTRMHTTFEFCMDVVNNGYFDDTRMPPTYASGNSTRGLITSPSVDRRRRLSEGAQRHRRRRGMRSRHE